MQRMYCELLRVESWPISELCGKGFPRTAEHEDKAVLLSRLCGSGDRYEGETVQPPCL